MWMGHGRGLWSAKRGLKLRVSRGDIRELRVKKYSVESWRVARLGLPLYFRHA